MLLNPLARPPRRARRRRPADAHRHQRACSSPNRVSERKRSHSRRRAIRQRGWRRSNIDRRFWPQRAARGRGKKGFAPEFLSYRVVQLADDAGELDRLVLFICRRLLDAQDAQDAATEVVKQIHATWVPHIRGRATSVSWSSASATSWFGASTAPSARPPLAAPTPEHAWVRRLPRQRSTPMSSSPDIALWSTRKPAAISRRPSTSARIAARSAPGSVPTWFAPLVVRPSAMEQRKEKIQGEIT